MDESKLLIIGVSGQLGKALHLKYPQAQAVDSNDLDITDFKSIKSFNWAGVSHILNAAAYTNVDEAETVRGRKAAWAVNAVAVANLARVANEHDLTLFHISSDYVFDGTLNNHTEEESLTPLSVYGASKAAGDLAASTANKHYIIRTSWVIGDGKNFVRTMIELSKKDVAPSVIHDQVGRLTFTSELVRAIDHIMNSQAEYGTYNVSNGGEPASWADITRAIYHLLGRGDLSVHNTTTKEYFADKQDYARRPLQSTLDLSKIQSIGFAARDWKADLENYLKGEKL